MALKALSLRRLTVRVNEGVRYGRVVRLKRSDPLPVYVFCEPVWQTRSRWHIRLLGADGARFPHGGLAEDASALCGLELGRGWDLSPEVTADVVGALRVQNETTHPGGDVICGRCADTYLKSVAA